MRCWTRSSSRSFDRPNAVVRHAWTSWSRSGSKSGQERWILIHVEVQTGKEGEFPRRMVVYNHRLFDRYDREVISLAILADDDPDWRPNQFGYSRWGFRTITEFPIVKLLDYALARPGVGGRSPTRSPWWCWPHQDPGDPAVTGGPVRMENCG